MTESLKNVLMEGAHCVRGTECSCSCGKCSDDGQCICEECPCDGKALRHASKEQS